MKLGLSMITFTAILVFLSTSAIAGPQFSFEKTAYDFKKTIQGETIVHTFAFRNTGNAPGTISRVTSSCGCTVADYSRKVIPPGQTGSITVRFDTTDYSGPTNKELLVFLDNQQNAAYTLLMKGTITEELVIRPRQINLGAVKPGVRKNVTITLENKGKDTLKIKSIKTPMPQTSIKFRKKPLKPGDKLAIKVSIIPQKNRRFVNGYLTISTNSKTKAEKTVAIFGMLKK